MNKLIKKYQMESYNIKVYFIPDKLIHEHTPDDLKSEGGDFRAFQGGSMVKIFLTPGIETKESLAWIFTHELVHIELHNWARMIEAGITKERNIFYNMLGYKSRFNAPMDVVLSDEVHESDPEEAFCNKIATLLIGYPYDRCWWRNKILKQKYKLKK
ncbi:MAG: hypothetical protein HQ543_03455 [Bacteroidetes bacterium]|nr:hypothetical protein [Bacteroidota bacterium]